ILVIAMAFCALVGLLIERVAYRPLRDKPRLTALITALSVSMLLQATGQLPWFMGPSPQFFPTLLPNGVFLEVGGVIVNRIEALTFVAAVALMFALHRMIFH